VPKAPYLERLQAPRNGGKLKDILEVFKQVQINIPFLDTIQQISSYAKFLKDLVTVKRKTNVSKKAFMTEQVTWVSYNHLGASVNLLPYSVYLQLGLGELKPTTMTL
jgi:hypothetical protein